MFLCVSVKSLFTETRAWADLLPLSVFFFLRQGLTYLIDWPDHMWSPHRGRGKIIYAWVSRTSACLYYLSFFKYKFGTNSCRSQRCSVSVVSTRSTYARQLWYQEKKAG